MLKFLMIKIIDPGMEYKWTVLTNKTLGVIMSSFPVIQAAYTYSQQ